MIIGDTQNPSLPSWCFSGIFNSCGRENLQRLASFGEAVFLENAANWFDQICHSVSEDLTNFHVGVKQFRSMLGLWDVNCQAPSCRYQRKARFLRLLVFLVVVLGKFRIKPECNPWVIGDYAMQFCLSYKKGIPVNSIVLGSLDVKRRSWTFGIEWLSFALFTKNFNFLAPLPHLFVSGFCTC